MIDTNELRDGVSKFGGGYLTDSGWAALIDRLEAAESDGLEQARLNGMGGEREAALMAKLEAAEKTNREWLRANAPGGWIDNLRIENEALRAEVIHIKEVEFPRKAQAVADGWRGKCERLEAKIAEMDRQEPAGYGVRYVEPTNGEEDWDSIWMHRVFAEDHIKDFTQAYVDIGEPVGAITVVPLYALPGAQAQPAPSINEGVHKVTLGFRWESEAQHHIPTIEIEFDPVSPDSPNDAKGWQDRDRIASMLSPEAKP